MNTATLPLHKSADTQLELHPFVRDRWSPRAFSGRSISVEDLARLLEAARWAPSCSNEQPWRFIVARKEDAATFAKILSVLDESNQIWTRHAPVLMLAVAKRTFSATGKPNRWGPHDVGLALGSLTLQASAMGIFVHPMAGFDPDKARSVFHIPEDFEPMTGVAIGYLGDPNTLPEKLKARELAPRTRKSMNEIVFGGDWGESLKLRTNG
jgi:nitroreductase